MSCCDGTGRAIGCPGCGVCDEEQALIDAAQAEARDVIAALQARYPRPGPNDVDPWADPIDRQEPTT